MTRQRRNSLLPIVEIPLEYVNFAESGSGQRYDPWSLTVANIPTPGDYVAYTPGGTGYSASEEDTGYRDQSSTPDKTVKWRIFKVAPDHVDLISADAVNDGFTLGGVNGYNNGVYLLNQACNQMYSNSSYGATARNIKLEDIGEISSEDVKEGELTELNNKSYLSFPNVFMDEAVVDIDNQGYNRLFRT